MVLIFDSNSTHVCWCKIIDKNFIEGKCKFSESWAVSFKKKIKDYDKIKKVAYILRNGGEYIKKPVSYLTPRTLNRLKKCTKFLPEYNELTYQIANYFVKKIPNALHIMLCDTSFFLRLPEEAATYAVPYKLRKKGVRKYGGFGLSHYWAYRQIEFLIKTHNKRVISIYLGKYSSICAVENRNPVEISIGFTPVEGIPSVSTPGTIDPTIIFNLHSAGMSLREINELLSRKSGFNAFLGKKYTLKEIINNRDKIKKNTMREIYCYNIVKYVGSYISLLGGVEGIAFFCENPHDYKNFILEICKKLAFLGLKCKANVTQKQTLLEFTKRDSSIKVYCFEYNKWRVLNQYVNGPLSQGGKRW